MPSESDDGKYHVAAATGGWSRRVHKAFRRGRDPVTSQKSRTTIP